eukprot:1194589-Prorocentrum_minimum.AAC.4
MALSVHTVLPAAPPRKLDAQFHLALVCPFGGYYTSPVQALAAHLASFPTLRFLSPLSSLSSLPSLPRCGYYSFRRSARHCELVCNEHTHAHTRADLVSVRISLTRTLAHTLATYKPAPVWTQAPGADENRPLSRPLMSYFTTEEFNCPPRYRAYGTARISQKG